MNLIEIGTGYMFDKRYKIGTEYNRQIDTAGQQQVQHEIGTAVLNPIGTGR